MQRYLPTKTAGFPNIPKYIFTQIHHLDLRSQVTCNLIINQITLTPIKLISLI